MRSEKKKIGVVGSGIGGLCTAARLAAKGYEVTVFEANNYFGGKLTQLKLGDYRFDAGPSLFTMPHYLEELFKDCGEDLKSFMTYNKMPVSCNYFYEDQTRFSFYAEKNKLKEELETKLKIDAEVVFNHLDKSKWLYDQTAPIFLQKSLHKLKNLLNTHVLKAILNIFKFNLLSTMNQVNEKKLKDPKLVQLFNRYATYNGSDPYQAPAMLNVIPSLEHSFGTFLPTNGMHEISKSVYELAQKLGVEFKFQEKVDQILVDNNEVKGVKTVKSVYNFDFVVSNMDVVPTYRKLLKNQKAPEKILNQERSSSALIFYWGVKKKFPELDLHNILFSENYKEEFKVLFKDQKIYEDPTVYINITSKFVKEDAPEGGENWFILVNAPADKNQDWETIIKQTRQAVINKINRNLKVDLASLIEEEEILTPKLIQSKTSSFLGALYGTSSNSKWAAFLRHANFSKDIKGLYFCGGSVHPGGGIPLCVLSSKIVADEFS